MMARMCQSFPLSCGKYSGASQVKSAWSCLMDGFLLEICFTGKMLDYRLQIKDLKGELENGRKFQIPKIKCQMNA